MMKRFLLAAVLSTTAVYAQDAGQLAIQQAQMANQQAIQANQQAAAASQQAAEQANQQAMARTQQDTTPLVAITRQPKFSVKPGVIAPGTTVSITCPTHYATIYYTTDGWFPTASSHRYTGPIQIDSTTELQAIAISPHSNESLNTSAVYTVPGTSSAIAQPVILPSDGVLHAGTPLRLITDSDVNSKTAKVGDKLGLRLDQDVKAGNAVVVPKGTAVEATLTVADRSGVAGQPGDIAFEIHSLTVGATTVPLRGGETIEGANHYKSKYFLLIPAVGAIPAIMAHGNEAQIRPGMMLNAAVAADTPLRR